MKIFLDSCVIIEKIKERILLNQKDEYWINATVYAEVGYGFLRIGKSLDDWEIWLKINKVNLVDIGLQTARIYTKLKILLRQSPIDEKDLLIASSCVEGRGKLWTLNRKHFERVPGLELVD
ncbi:type II toxin-antitoxin system VapC family toxin [Candidatus Shapirobacteria bacterium]|nr:type II toxin-antitoxin system VapC family toxin [Candidatus Shapirobacteria bacterium]